MKLSLHLPMDIDQEKEFQTAKAIRSIAVAAEKAGLGAVNTTDHPAPSNKWRFNGAMTPSIRSPPWLSSPQRPPGFDCTRTSLFYPIETHS
jgi:hypothetical protein